MKKIFLITSFIFTCFFTISHAQTLSELTEKLQNSVISISAEGEAFYPADIITLQISMQIIADSPGSAFEKHKQLEDTVVDIIAGFGVRDSSIVFEPFRINRIRNNQQFEYRTSQTVQLTLMDFDAYEEIQVTLIENGFDNFQATFQSSENRKGHRESLKNALENAKQKAELIAAELGLEIRNIASVDYSESDPSYPVLRTESMRAGGSSSLMNVPQMVKFSNGVNIRFNAGKAN